MIKIKQKRQNPEATRPEKLPQLRNESLNKRASLLESGLSIIIRIAPDAGRRFWPDVARIMCSQLTMNGFEDLHPGNRFGVAVPLGIHLFNLVIECLIGHPFWASGFGGLDQGFPISPDVANFEMQPVLPGVIHAFNLGAIPTRFRLIAGSLSKFDPIQTGMLAICETWIINHLAPKSRLS